MEENIPLAVAFLFCTVGYLLGSLSAAIIISRIFGLPDPRKVGSGNPGATNILRYAGKKVAAITLVLDAVKGAAPVKIAFFLGATGELCAFVGLFAFLGHLFPIFHKFKGGKGVATFLGVTAALYWQIGLCFIASWTFIALLTRYSSLSALASSVLVLFLVWIQSQSFIFTGCFF